MSKMLVASFLVKSYRRRQCCVLQRSRTCMGADSDTWEDASEEREFYQTEGLRLMLKDGDKGAPRKQPGR